MVRRSFFYFLTVALVGLGGYQLAWHRDLREQVLQWRVYILLLGIALVLFLFIWSWLKPNRPKVVLAVVIGAAAVLSLQTVFHSLQSLLWVLIALVALCVLWMLTVFGPISHLVRFTQLMRSYVSLKSTPSSDPAATSAPAHP